MIQSDFPTRQPAPKIGENGNWLEWDEQTQAYVDTGVTAASVIDATLTVAGEAADAKAAGDRLSALDELADEVTEDLDWNLIHWDFTSKTVQGATFTVNDDGTLTVNGTVNTANAHNGIKLLDAADIDHTAAYTVKRAVVSEDAPVSGDTTTRWTWWGYGETASGEVTACRFGVPTIIPEGMSVFLLVSKRASFHNQRQTVQVYKGSESLPYVPPYSCSAVDAVARYDSENRAQKKLIAAVEASATATTNYVTGDLVIVGDTLCKVTENIAAGGTITDGVNVRETTVAAELALAAASGDGDSRITVDTALSASSTNPVENRAIQAALDGKADRITEVTISDTGTVTQALEDNKIYHFTGALTALTLTLTAPAAGQPAQYHFDFLSGATAPTVTLPNTVVMPSGWSVEANHRYEVDILNGYGLASGWEVEA